MQNDEIGVRYIKSQPDKVWLIHPSGEAGVFDKKKYEEAPDKKKFFEEEF